MPSREPTSKKAERARNFPGAFGFFAHWTANTSYSAASSMNRFMLDT